MKKIIWSLVFATTTGIFAGTYNGSGTIAGDNNVIISSKGMGFVTELNVIEGQKVHQGQTIFVIDDNSINLKVEQIKHVKETYVADLISLERNLSRYKRLLTKDMVAKVEVENLETNYQKLDSLVKLYDAQIKEVEDMRKYFSIKSPIEGHVIQKNIKKGEMYMPGMPAVVLTDLSNLVVEVDVSDRDIELFQNIYKKIKVSVPSIGYDGIATVDRILPTLNPMTHTFKVKLKINQNGKLYPGMYVNIEIN